MKFQQIELAHKSIQVHVGEGGHQKHAITTVQHATMSRDERAKILHITCSFEAAAKESSNWADGAGEDTDGCTMNHKC